MKKPKLKIIAPAKFEATEVRQHLNKAIEMAYKYQSPVIGFALVTFHENKAYCTSWHTTKAGIHQADLPDMVRNRLLVDIAKQP